MSAPATATARMQTPSHAKPQPAAASPRSQDRKSTAVGDIVIAFNKKDDWPGNTRDDTTVTGPGRSAPRACRVRGASAERISRIASGAKYMTAEDLPSSRPFSVWIRSIAARLSGSHASP